MFQLSSFVQEAQLWCKGKQWWWRFLLLVWFGFVFFDYLKNPNPRSLFGPLNLGIHELGHLIFAWTGQFFQVAGGTITQLAAPLYGMWNFHKQKDFFALSLCFGWLSTNFFNVSYYMADARTMNIELVSLGGREGIIHDWNYLLSHMGLLPFDHILASIIWFLAVLSMGLCFFAGGWLLWKMVSLKS